MGLFWSFWIPINFMFWWFMAAGVKQPKKIHFMVASFFAITTGVVPFVLSQYIK